MSEPISGSAAAGAAGAAAFKALGGPAAVAGGASVLATIVVMVMTLPKNRSEWAVALISTVVASLCGGTPPDRNRVAATLIAALAHGLAEFEREGFAAFRTDYARHDLLRGKPLRLSGALGAFEALGAGVDARGALRVQLPDGSERRLDSAEVTVRRT